jgi:hypothetical protein
MNNLEKQPESGAPPQVKTINITVNGKAKTIAITEHLTFREVVLLAYSDAQFGPDFAYTVTYQRDHSNHSGSLDDGQSFKPTNGTVIDVVRSNRS